MRCLNMLCARPFRTITLTIIFGAVCVMAYQPQANAIDRQIGISGIQDKKGRNPDLAVSKVMKNEVPTILVDAQIPEPGHRIYPIRFDFYINRRLFSSQIRSDELPGAVGVSIGPDIAAVPFTYAVVATLMSPNRFYTSMLTGAFFASNLLATFDCTLTLSSDDGEESTDYVANDVATDQSGNNSFSFSFDANSISVDSTVALSASVSTSGEDKAAGTLTVTRDSDGSTTRVTDVSGTATFDDSGNLKSLSVESDDKTTSLVCS
ncbi:hypothetical protein OAO01_03785 [Oligoflexia bacterium]|nr:hypothetical protein [Oligoflexia bacterium]